MIQTAIAVFSTSRNAVINPVFQPSVTTIFEAPALPVPLSRISIPWIYLDIKNEKSEMILQEYQRLNEMIYSNK